MKERTTSSPAEAAYNDYLMPTQKSLNVPVEWTPGCTLEDFDDDEYLDMFLGISVTNVGHNNEAVVETTTEQLGEFVHGCSYVHLNRPVTDPTEIVVEVTLGDLQKTFFCNSGTEVVEGTIKLTRRYADSKEVISLEMDFRGRTLDSFALIGNRTCKQGMAPTINDVAHTVSPYAHRYPRCDGGTCGADCVDVFEWVTGSHTGGDLAAVVVGPVTGEAGIVVLSEAWLKHIRDIVHDHGALLIADEAQAGYSHTGELFASKQFGVESDILTQAKGIANGLPLGTFTTPADVADTFDSGDHFSTFGDNPVACVATLATTEKLQSGIIDNVYENGEWLSAEPATFESDYGVVGEARGLGLIQGIELVDPKATSPQRVAPASDKELAAAVGEHLREEFNVVTGVDDYYEDTTRFQPPLTISQMQLGGAVNAFRTTLNSLA